MHGDTHQRAANGSRAALKIKVAGTATAGVAVSLVLAPEALALISPNHNETVLALNGALLLQGGRQMDSDTQQHDECVARGAASKLRVAAIMTAGVMASLVLAPEALAMINPNHNETVLALDEALLPHEDR
jgi:hypothetical protein